MKPSGFFVGMGVALIGLGWPLYAGTGIDSNQGKELSVPAVEVKLNEVSFAGSYTFGADFRNDKYGNIDAAFYDFKAGHRFALPMENWYLRLGLAYERIDFGLGRAPVPSHLQGVAAVIAVERLVHGQVGLLFETRPGLYFANDLSGDAFDFPTDIGFAYPLSDRVFLVFGASFAMMRRYPVIPVAGLRWLISDQWDLKLYLPEPRLVYMPSKKVAFWAGGSVEGGAFRADNRDIKPESLRNAVVTYSEIRAGAGATIQICPTVALEFSGGYAMDRSFNYHRASEEYKLENAPYASCKLTTEF